MTQHRIGMIGLGFISSYHAKAIRAALPGCELVGVDVSPEARRLAMQRGIVSSTVDSVEQLIALSPRAAHVLTPPHLHKSVALPLLDSRIDVLIEKPLAHTVADCSELARAAARSGARVGISHNQLFFEIWDQARAMLASGDLGRVRTVDVKASRPLGFLRAGDVRPWMMRAPTNLLFEVAPHSFAQLLDTVSPVDVHSVRAGSVQRLSNGVDFYRQWDILAAADDVAITIGLSFEDAFATSTIALRGSLGSLMVDFDRNTIITQRRTFASFDLEPFEQSAAAVWSVSRGAVSTLGKVVRGKAGAPRMGDPFTISLNRSVKRFYDSLIAGATVDPRHDLAFATSVVALAATVAERAGLPQRPSVVRPPEPVGSEPSAAPRVLVVGGTGFIGKEFVRQLSKLEPVRVVARNPAAASQAFDGCDVEIVSGDIRRLRELTARVDPGMAVYQLAFGGGSTWEELKEADVDPSIAFADACAAIGVERFVYASSIAVYNGGRVGQKITERTPFSPGVLRVAPYARAKAAVEEHLMSLRSRQDFPVIVVRPGIVVGANSDPCHWGVAAWRHSNVAVHWGAGKNPLPIVLVEDVADALVRIRDGSYLLGESFNLCAPPCVTAEEYIEELSRASGSKVRRRPNSALRFYSSSVVKWAIKFSAGGRVPFPSWSDCIGRSFGSTFDCSKAELFLGWKPVSDKDELVRRGVTEPAIAWGR